MTLFNENTLFSTVPLNQSVKNVLLESMLNAENMNDSFETRKY